MADYGLLATATGKSPMDTAVLSRYMSLPMPADTVQAEYVFIDAFKKARSKCRTVSAKAAQSAETLPSWTYDGSSTGQAPGKDSEVIMKPRCIFADPFRPNGKNVLVLCDTYDAAGNALPTNTRAAAAELFLKYEGEKPWFGIEQGRPAAQRSARLHRVLRREHPRRKLPLHRPPPASRSLGTPGRPRPQSTHSSIWTARPRSAGPRAATREHRGTRSSCGTGALSSVPCAHSLRWQPAKQARGFFPPA